VTLATQAPHPTSYLCRVLKKILPILSWLPDYNRRNFAKDIPSGITVGIMLVPQGMAYALIAGLPMVYGLYASLVPQIIYGITGTSRQLSVGPVAMDSLLVAAGLMSIASLEAGGTHYIELAIVLAMMMGIFQLLLGVLRAGFLVNFLSRPVISGFTSAAAIIIGVNQIPNLTGASIEKHNRIQNFISAASDSITEIHSPTLLLGVAAIMLIVIAGKFKKITKLPAALVVVVVGILACMGLGLDSYGVAIVGEIPQGLPSFNMPTVNESDFYQLLPIAITLALVAFMEAYSVAKTIEEKHDYKIDANQELRALGLSNIIGSMFQSYPTTGGFSRSAVNDQAGATTAMSSIIAAVLIGLTLLFLTPLFTYLPMAVLAAIVMVAVAGLIDVKLPFSLWKTHKTDALLLLATFITTLTVGMTYGILTGVVLSILVLVYKQMRPHFAELGEIEGIYRNFKRFPEANRRDDVVIVRFDSALHFSNHRHLHASINEILEGRDGVKAIILCAKVIGYIDASGIKALEDIINELEAKGIDFRLAAAIGPVRDTINSSELIARIGKKKCFATINHAIRDFDNPGSIDGGSRKVATQSN
jgi:SulP family sulfate permease